MLGAITGDIIGSAFASAPIKTTDFPLFGPDSRFTDDTVVTVAVAFAVLSDGDYTSALRIFGRMYPLAGYEPEFNDWLIHSDSSPYGSSGHGSAKRVSPVGFAFGTEAEVLAEAEASAAVTHDHPEGIKGAKAVAFAIYLARNGAAKEDIRQEIESRFGYDLQGSLDEIRPAYRYQESCQGTVPEAILAFLESKDFEEAVRLAVSLGGASDTLATITGGIAHAFYGEVPAEIQAEVRGRLPKDLLEIVDEFSERYSL